MRESFKNKKRDEMVQDLLTQLEIFCHIPEDNISSDGDWTLDYKDSTEEWVDIELDVDGHDEVFGVWFSYPGKQWEKMRHRYLKWMRMTHEELSGTVF